MATTAIIPAIIDPATILQQVIIQIQVTIPTAMAITQLVEIIQIQDIIQALATIPIAAIIQQQDGPAEIIHQLMEADIIHPIHITRHRVQTF